MFFPTQAGLIVKSSERDPITGENRIRKSNLVGTSDGELKDKGTYIVSHLIQLYVAHMDIQPWLLHREVVGHRLSRKIHIN